MSSISAVELTTSRLPHAFSDILGSGHHVLLAHMTCMYNVLVLPLVIFKCPCASWDGTCASLVVRTPRTLALATVLQAALAWLPGVTPPVVPEAGDAYSKALLWDLPAPGSWDGVSYVFDPANVSDVI